MIITCEQCSKKFEIESSLISENGRLLQCSSCNHQWFYKKNILKKSKVVLKKENIKTEQTELKIEDTENIKVFDDLINAKSVKRKHSYTAPKGKKISFLSLTLVFVISVTALIVLLDTFKSPINLMIPNIEFVLDNLYETFKDILLFIQDLI